MTSLDSSIKNASRIMGHAAHSGRLKILLLLKENPRHVGEITGMIGASQPAISHHLRLMRASGVVEDVRAGHRVIYSLSPLGHALVSSAQSIMRV